MSQLLSVIFPIVAQLSKWERLGDGLRKTGGHRELIDLWPIALLGVLFAGAAYAIVVWRRRNDFTRRCNDPEKLFRELCHTHELEKEDHQLLRQLAAARELASPASIFLQPSALAAGTLPEELRPHASRLSELQRQIF